MDIETKTKLVSQCANTWLMVCMKADTLAGGWGLGEDDRIIAAIIDYGVEEISGISKAMNDNDMFFMNPWTPYLHVIETRRYKDGIQAVPEDTKAVA